MDKAKSSSGNQNKVSQKSIKSILSDFASNTTAHGLSQIVNNKVLAVKLLWIFIIIVCQVMLYFQIKPLFENYLERPTKTKIDLEYNPSQNFPMVTICTTNIIKASKMNEFKADSKTYNNNDSKADDQSNYSSSGEEVDNDDDDGYQFNEDDFDRDLTPSKNAKEIYHNKLETLTNLANIAQHKKDQVFKYGHQFDEIFNTCTWRDVYDCQQLHKFWKQIWHWKYGNCFTFNVGDSKRIRRSKTVGPDSGLDLELEIPKKEIVHSIGSSTAVIVHIAEQGSRIEPYLNGFSLPPNYKHYVSISKTKIKRADPFKNGSCIKEATFDFGSRSFSYPNVTRYSLQACRDICQARMQIDKCGCSEHHLPSLDGNRSCSYYSKDYDCFYPINTANADNTIPCMKDCRLPCEESVYEKEISSRKYTPFVDKGEEAELENYEYFRIVLSFKTLETRVIKNMQFYFIENLLSDIGGQLGLFSGISALTVVEVIILIFTLVIHFFRSFKTKKKEDMHVTEEAMTLNALE